MDTKVEPYRINHLYPPQIRLEQRRERLSLKVDVRPVDQVMTTISISEGATTISLTLNDITLCIEQSNTPSTRRDIPCRNIIHAALDTKTRLVKVAYLFKKKTFQLFVVEGQVQENELPEASKWVEVVMESSYAGISRSRRLLVFVNPHGGKQQAVPIFEQKIRPIFLAAGCSMEVIQTTGKNHAYEVVKSMPFVYDAIITVSGDGLIHEVLNGLAHHSDPTRAFATPVAPIPTGSGNGLSLNLLGVEDGFDVRAASLNAIKGSPMKVDLFSFIQNNKRTVSFMSQTVGLMADLDLETEHLRWMGDSRFVYGFIKGVIQYRSCPIQLSYKLVENDKKKMAKAVHARIVPTGDSTTKVPSEDGTDMDNWISFDEPISYLYAGKGPYVSRDLMAFPVSLPNDGLIDISIMANSSRADILGATKGAKVGANFWHPKIQYLKVTSYRVKPLLGKGNLSVDGEAFPFDEFQVDIHNGLGSFLSLHGHYISLFDPRIPAEVYS